ncbi:MAG: trypsin-like peptidase domain-containing protein [Eubacteriales bacterium]|nr:trypsin-like peptidase domain-containing protein [Eubacteriales bacterium]
MSEKQRFGTPQNSDQHPANYPPSSAEERVQYDLQRSGEQYRYQTAAPEIEDNHKTSAWLVATALILLGIFIFSIVGMHLLFNRSAEQAKKRILNHELIWDAIDDEAEGDSEQAAKAPSETELDRANEGANETPDAPLAASLSPEKLRQLHFSLEEASKQYRNGQQSLSIAEIAALGKASVVAISTEASVVDLFGDVRQASFAGSGFIISPDGYIATNSHVIKASEKIFVKLDNGVVYQAQVVGADQATDLAVIKLLDYDGKNELPPAILGSSEDLVVGELAVAIGNPTGQLEGTVTNGIISALNREINIQGLDMTMIQTNASVNSGNSGGALFNSFGEVVGVITGKISSQGRGQSFEGLGFAIPIDLAKPVLEDLIRYGYVRGRVSIGIYPESVSREMANYYGIADRAGVLIVQVLADSPAAEAGLEKGDLLISMNGQNVENINDINRYKRDLKPGDRVKIEFYRDGKLHESELTLVEFTPDN